MIELIIKDELTASAIFALNITELAIKFDVLNRKEEKESKDLKLHASSSHRH